MFDDLIRFVFADWWISLPMLAASVFTVAVIFERALFFNRNTKDVEQLTQRLQRSLEQGNYTQAQFDANMTGGVMGSVAEEGVKLLSRGIQDFNLAFDIRIGLGMRKLEKNLASLGTIGAIAPFVGLLGTVVGILRSFQTFSSAGAQSSKLAEEIGFALVATAAGLVIAIIAVLAYNIFNGILSRFEDEMQQLKLLFMGFHGKALPSVTNQTIADPAYPKNLL